MKIAIAYTLTILGLPVAVAAVAAFILAFPFYLIFEKLFGEKIKKWLILDFIREITAGIFTVWFTIILWSWLGVMISILIPVLLAIPIIIWAWQRIKPNIKANSSWSEGLGFEVISEFGILVGVIIGSVLLL